MNKPIGGRAIERQARCAAMARTWRAAGRRHGDGERCRAAHPDESVAGGSVRRVS